MLRGLTDMFMWWRRRWCLRARVQVHLDLDEGPVSLDLRNFFWSHYAVLAHQQTERVARHEAQLMLREVGSGSVAEARPSSLERKWGVRVLVDQVHPQQILLLGGTSNRLR